MALCGLFSLWIDKISLDRKGSFLTGAVALAAAKEIGLLSIFLVFCKRTPSEFEERGVTESDDFSIRASTAFTSERGSKETAAGASVFSRAWIALGWFSGLLAIELGGFHFLLVASLRFGAFSCKMGLGRGS